MILEEETFEKFGYYPADLATKSSKNILALCDDCGKVRITSKHCYRALCISCGHKGERSSMFGRTAQRCPSYDKKGINHPSWKGGLVTIRCEFYDKEKQVRPDQIRKGWGKFCSCSCSRKARKRFPQHHTKPELIFEEICKKNNLPFLFVGDSQLWIGKRKKLNPDFVECNGKKICIEIMGDYWHSPLLNKKLREDALLSYRKRHYTRYRWKSVFIWGIDLLREDAEEFVLSELRKL